ncbi:hypothetical protein ACIOG4_28580 [Streptomyces microflavus]|uniref:hypothetical protein n=1 Tax=Streptomyces microflavus TaxID=1919 RepID=UPI0038204E2F
MSRAWTVFEPAFDDNPGWEGADLYDDLAIAQKLAREAYHHGVLGGVGGERLTWQPDGADCWNLLDGDEPTPVSIQARAVRSAVGHLARGPSPEDQLAMASEFRIPLPLDDTRGGYGEVVVQRDGISGRFAVTDGALVRLQTWVDGGGWCDVSDVGRAVAFSRSRENALETALHVAGIEADRHRRRTRAGG